jgi:DNA mismatch endonuclease (patch repair protein)
MENRPPKASETGATPVVPSSGSTQMSRQRRRDTVPELRLRKVLFARGLRYRGDAPLPGMGRRREDVLVMAANVAVLVDGCFWHSCPLHGTLPRSNHDWWLAKLEKNVSRDRETDAHLMSIGWVVLRFLGA